MWSKLVLIVVIVLLTTITIACSNTAAKPNLESQRAVALNSRAEAFSKAEALYPVPPTNNFPLRQALVQFTERTDLVNHPWFVYVLGDNGNVLGYYVARTKPVNSCSFLSSSEALHSSSNGKVILTAPSLDGIYYGGAGASAGCDSFFFFDLATNAMIEIGGLKFWVADQPLAIEAEPILVQQSETTE